MEKKTILKSEICESNMRAGVGGLDGPDNGGVHGPVNGGVHGPYNGGVHGPDNGGVHGPDNGGVHGPDNGGVHGAACDAAGASGETRAAVGAGTSNGNGAALSTEVAPTVGARTPEATGAAEGVGATTLALSGIEAALGGGSVKSGVGIGEEKSAEIASSWKANRAAKDAAGEAVRRKEEKLKSFMRALNDTVPLTVKKLPNKLSKDAIMDRCLYFMATVLMETELSYLLLFPAHRIIIGKFFYLHVLLKVVNYFF